jgi:hypothetical protein
LIVAAFFCAKVSAQEPTADLVKIENEIAARKTKLADAAFTGQEREKVLQETASLLNQVGEIVSQRRLRSRDQSFRRSG